MNIRDLLKAIGDGYLSLDSEIGIKIRDRDSENNFTVQRIDALNLDQHESPTRRESYLVLTVNIEGK